MSFGIVVIASMVAVGAVTAAKVCLPYLIKGLDYISDLCGDYVAKREDELREKMIGADVDCGDVFGHDDVAGDGERGMKESIGHDGDAGPCADGPVPQATPDDARVLDDEEACGDECDDEGAEDIFDRVRNIVEGMPGPGEIIVVIAK